MPNFPEINADGSIVDPIFRAYLDARYSASQNSASFVKTPTDWVSGTAYKVGDYFQYNSDIFKVVAAHTAAVAPSVATARPADGASSYEIYASTGNSSNGLVRRSSTGAVTLKHIYMTDIPDADSSLTNKAYVDTLVASGIGTTNRPATTVAVIWNGTAWTTKGAVITARPSGLVVGDVVQFIGNPGGTLPTWAATNDLWTQG